MLARGITLVVISLLIWFASACSLTGFNRSEQACFPIEELSSEDREIAEDWLERALDYEGLYTVFGPVKPVSNVIISWFPLLMGSDSLDVARHRMQQMQRIAHTLECGQVTSVWIPFNQLIDNKRFVQLSFVNKEAYRRVMREDSLYWIQWGFTQETRPDVVLTTLEFEQNSIRHRGLGYLYGYPAYAVDFFVDSRIREDSTHRMVARDFFQIPVNKAETGHFTYAIPKGYQPGAEDSLRYYRAMEILNRYREMRPEFLRPDSSLRAVDLIRSWKRAERVRQNPVLSR